MIQSETQYRSGLSPDSLPPRPSKTERPPTLADKLREHAEDFVASYPVVCVGAALAGGLLLGWWVKRK